MDMNEQVNQLEKKHELAYDVDSAVRCRLESRVMEGAEVIAQSTGRKDVWTKLGPAVVLKTLTVRLDIFGVAQTHM